MFALSVEDVRTKASLSLPRAVFDHFDGGVDDEDTMAENRRGFTRIRLVQRLLTGNGSVDLGQHLLGLDMSCPVILAPTGHHAAAHPDGELATARAAARVGAPLTVSTGSSYSLEEVREVSEGPLWFQLFPLNDRRLMESLVHRADTAGYQAIVVTADTQVVGNFERSIRSGSVSPPMREGNLERYIDPPARLVDMFTGSWDWSLVDWVRSVTDLPLVLKGVQCAEDAEIAVHHGAAGIYVSNHGGRQLDSCPSTIELLDEVASVVGDRAPVIVDGGFRRGTDIVKALCLGADAVSIGRPYLYGLAAGGQEGVEMVLDILRTEIRQALQLMGCPSVQSLDRSWVRPSPLFGFGSFGSPK